MVQLNGHLVLCDLTPLDYVKILVYANKPTTLEELRNNIEREIANVRADICGRVVDNSLQRNCYVLSIKDPLRKWFVIKFWTSN